MNRKLFLMELFGIGAVAVCAFPMRRLHQWDPGGLLGILFGAVNSSPWEYGKTLLMPALVWGVIEVLALRLSVHRFTVAKTASLYLLGAGYLLLRSLGVGEPAAATVMLAASVLLTMALYGAEVPLKWAFAPAIVLLFLFTALYFSLSPFPPHHPLFRDSATGMYGIIPPQYDYGASALDALYLR